MTCRHRPGDPDCGSYAREEASRIAREIRAEEEAERSRILRDQQQAERFDIVDIHRVNGYVVLKVRYETCKDCSFDGDKVMVFGAVNEAELIRWRRIDPHFRAPPASGWPAREAPSPLARFPATDKGWEDAIKFASTRSIQ